MLIYLSYKLNKLFEVWINTLTKKLFIKTFGCQMNFYDSEKMFDLLINHGYEKTDIQENADLI